MTTPDQEAIDALAESGFSRKEINRAMTIIGAEPAFEAQRRPIKVLDVLCQARLAERAQCLTIDSRGRQWPSYRTSITAAGVDYLRSRGFDIVRKE